MYIYILIFYVILLKSALRTKYCVQENKFSICNNQISTSRYTYLYIYMTKLWFLPHLYLNFSSLFFFSLSFLILPSSKIYFLIPQYLVETSPLVNMKKKYASLTWILAGSSMTGDGVGDDPTEGGGGPAQSTGRSDKTSARMLWTNALTSWWSTLK